MQIQIGQSRFLMKDGGVVKAINLLRALPKDVERAEVYFVLPGTVTFDLGGGEQRWEPTKANPKLRLAQDAGDPVAVAVTMDRHDGSWKTVAIGDSFVGKDMMTYARPDNGAPVNPVETSGGKVPYAVLAEQGDPSATLDQLKTLQGEFATFQTSLP